MSTEHKAIRKWLNESKTICNSTKFQKEEGTKTTIWKVLEKTSKKYGIKKLTKKRYLKLSYKNRLKISKMVFGKGLKEPYPYYHLEYESNSWHGLNVTLDEYEGRNGLWVLGNKVYYIGGLYSKGKYKFHVLGKIVLGGLK